jgi:hypothetical protein
MVWDRLKRVDPGQHAIYKGRGCASGWARRNRCFDLHASAGCRHPRTLNLRVVPPLRAATRLQPTQVTTVG